MATIDDSGLVRFRRWYNQYVSTHGTPPPRHMMGAFLEGEQEARIARSERSRMLDLEQQRLNFQQDIAMKELGMMREKMKQEAGAARLKGFADLGMAAYTFRKPISQGIGAVKDFLGIGRGTSAATSTGPMAGDLEAFAGAGGGAVSVLRRQRVSALRPSRP